MAIRGYAKVSMNAFSYMFSAPASRCPTEVYLSSEAAELRASKTKLHHHSLGQPPIRRSIQLPFTFTIEFSVEGGISYTVS